MTPNLDEISEMIRQLAAKIGAPMHTLPKFGSSEQSGRAHVEVNFIGYHYVVCERGREFKRNTTQDIDQLLYWVFQSATHSMGMAFEFHHRVRTQDGRRLIWQHQLDLLQILNPSWRLQCETEIQVILKRCPYDDSIGLRVDYIVYLRNSGMSADEASRLGYLKYPSPQKAEQGS